MSWNRVISALFLLSLLALVPAASADPITWNLSGVTFKQGGAASGSFTYDAATNTYGSINITVTGELFGNGTYSALDPGFASTSNYILPVQGLVGNFTGLPLLAFVFSSPLTNAGGAIGLLPPQGIHVCITNTCSASLLVDSVRSGQVVSSTAPVPEPSSLLLLGAGLAGLIGKRLRKRPT